MLLRLALLLLGDRECELLHCFFPPRVEMLTARVAHQVLVCGFSSCAIALKSDFAAAKAGRRHQTKPKIISRMSHRAGKDAGRERRELTGRGIQTALGGQCQLLQMGSAVKPPSQRGAGGGEENVRTDDVALKRKKKKDRGNEHNSSFTCCYYFFFF